MLLVELEDFQERHAGRRLRGSILLRQRRLEAANQPRTTAIKSSESAQIVNKTAF